MENRKPWPDTASRPHRRSEQLQRVKETEMAIAQSPSTRSELADRSRAFLMRHRMFIAVELVLLIATLALVAIVNARPGPLPGDVSIALWCQPLARPQQGLKAVLDLVRTRTWPLQAG